VPRARVQSEVQAEHVRRRQQLIEAHVLRALRLFLRNLRPVVILYRHTERAGSMRYCPANTAHSEDAEGLARGIVAESEV